MTARMRAGDMKGRSGGAIAVLSAMALLVANAADAGAQGTYPVRPIRLLVPNPPDGATDNLARVIAPRLTETLGQTVVVDNRPGSNGNLATEAAAPAAPYPSTPDLSAHSQIGIGPHL